MRRKYSHKGNAATKSAVLDAPNVRLPRGGNGKPSTPITSGVTSCEPPPPPARTVAFDSYCESYCEWMTRNFGGIETSMECIEADGNRVVEFRNRPLVSMQVYVGANAVTVIGLTFGVNGHKRLYEVTGVRSVQLERDAAGFPTRLEMAGNNEKTVLWFTGNPQPAPNFSRNSWGE
jgi:hypothetical protein